MWILLFALALFGVSGTTSEPARPARTAAAPSPTPELPRATVDTAYRPPTTGTIFRPEDADAFRAALVSAKAGDRIVLRAGTVYEGAFELPAKSGSDWIYIESSDVDQLPPPGTRVSPTDAAHMPRVVSSSAAPAIKTLSGAHNYRLVGIDLGVTDAVTLNYGVVVFGDASDAQLSTSGLPHHLVVDRCFVHGNDHGDILRGVILNSATAAVVDSYLSSFHSVQFDSQAVLGWTGPGPFKVVNNYLEGSGENLFFGGADSKRIDLIPSDIEVRRNHLRKPLSWNPDDPSFAGTAWIVKNLFEIKCAKRVLVEGNVFENCWPSGQTGEALAIKTTDQDLTAPWTETSDITLRYNVIRNCSEGVQFVARENTATREITRRVTLRDNVFENIHGKRMYYLATVSSFTTSAGVDFRNCEDVIIDHNTSLNTNAEIGVLLVPDGTLDGKFAIAAGFQFTNNIAGYGQYGILGGLNDRPGLPTISKYFVGSLIDHNVIVGGASHSDEFPGTQYFPDSFDSGVGFVAFRGGSSGDYRLSPASPYHNVALDGRDPGADVDALEKAIAGVTIDRLAAIDEGEPSFRIKIVGANFDPDAQVFINNSSVAWDQTKFKRDTQILLTGGKDLRRLLPSGTRIAIRVVNPNGDEATKYFSR